jgi:hypothetical protein
MQHLQRVALSADSCRADTLAHLPSSLTYLQLYKGEDHEYARLAVRAANLPQLPALRELHLGDIALEHSVLGQWTGLQTLELDGVGFLSADDEGDEATNSSGDTRDLLTELGRLTQLQVRTLRSGVGLAAGPSGG